MVGTGTPLVGADALLLPRLRRDGVRGDTEGEVDALESPEVGVGSTVKVGPLRCPFCSDPRRAGF